MTLHEHVLYSTIYQFFPNWFLDWSFLTSNCPWRGRQEILFPWCISSYSLTCLIPLVKREAGMFFAPCRGGGIWLIINATFWWKSVVMCLSEGSNFVTLGLEILLYCLVKWLETITMTDADGAFYSCIWRIWFFLELYVNCYKGVGCKKGTSCQSDSWKFSL